MWKERIIVNVNDHRQFNRLLKTAASMPNGIVLGDPDRFIKRKGCAFVWQTDVRIWLSFSTDGKVRYYNFRLDGEIQSAKTAMNIWKNFSQFYKTPHFHECKEKAPFSASPFLYYNEDYEGKRVPAIGYDLNSAYGNAVLKANLPDTTRCETGGIVRDGYMGFDIHGNIVYEGYANWVFPIMTSEQKAPIIRYFLFWWDKKIHASNEVEKKTAKDHLNIVVGYWQKYNCFMRAAVVGYVNDYIKSITKDRDDVLFCNTDSIVCLNEIPELEIGTDLGQWKVEHTGVVAYIGFNYQWNNDLPSYRGISRAWFKEGYDILKDGIPTEYNIYYYNVDKNKVELRKYEEDNQEITEHID